MYIFAPLNHHMARPVKATEKKQELMEKAQSCFTRFGYSKTTLDDIAREANMNKATLYHYFKNKEELFLQVMLQVAKTGLESLMVKTQQIKSAEKQLLYFFTERMDLYLQLVRLNSLTRESLLQLQAMFDSIYQPEKEKEITFVTGIIKSLLNNNSSRQNKEYARMFFSVADALKHQAVFLGKLLNNEAADRQAVKKQIAESIQLIIKGLLK
jgi:AcrR family transcriptional regulator